MSEVYIREVRGNPKASIRDVEVLDKRFYERNKALIREVTEQAVRAVMSSEGPALLVDKVYFDVDRNGRIYVSGEGPVAEKAREILKEKQSNYNDSFNTAVAASFWLAILLSLL